MHARYLRERAALERRVGDTVEITCIGGPVEFLDCGPRPDDYVALARRAFVRGDLTVDEFDAELERALLDPANRSPRDPDEDEA